MSLRSSIALPADQARRGGVLLSVLCFASFLVSFLGIGLGGPRTASAQTGTGGASGGTLTASDFLIVVQDAAGSAVRDFDLQRLFNVGNCQCNLPLKIFFTLSTSGFQKKALIPTGTISFWIGTACDNATPSLRNCVQLGDTQVLTQFANLGGITVNTTAQQLSQNFGQPSISTGDGGIPITGTGPSGPQACGTGIAFTQNIWALVTRSTTTVYDPSVTLQVQIDLAPPPPPVAVSVGPGNEALVVSWTGIDTTTLDDLLGYQVLCDRAGQYQVFADGTFTPGFITCPTNPIPPGDFGHIIGLDPRYVCSPQLATTSSSFRVKILQNAITYGIGVVAIDTHYNASQPLIDWNQPQKTLSFYDVYRNGDEANTHPGAMPEPGRAGGGFCAVAPAGPGAGGNEGGAVALAVLAGALGLGARRRRRSRWGRP